MTVELHSLETQVEMIVGGEFVEMYVDMVVEFHLLEI